MSAKVRMIMAIITAVCIIVMAVMGLGIWPVLITAAVFTIINVIIPSNKKGNKKKEKKAT